jgi:hypothetical protein
MSENAESTTYQQLTLSVAGSRAKTLAMPESVLESLKELDLACGLNTSESFANYDPDSCSWKTSQRSLFGNWAPYSETWPRAGMMRNGRCYQRRPLVPPILGTDASFLPTPTAYDSTPGGPNNHYQGLGNLAKHYPERLIESLREMDIYIVPPIGEHLPELMEWLMGFPVGWTGLEP